MKRYRWLRPYVLGSAGMIVVMAIVLLVMGRSVWCSCGELNPWSGDIWSKHNSQHVVDPYVFTHVLHGVLFYGLLFPLSRWLVVRSRFFLAVALECTWEIAENTNMVIERYRESTISLDYYGDSVINSIADVIACICGFGFAAAVPVAVSIATFTITELVLMATIRDSLVLNMIMLVHPIEAIKDWQGG